jgi:hypothetical protein
MALELIALRSIYENVGRDAIIRAVLHESGMKVPWIDCHELYCGQHDV